VSVLEALVLGAIQGATEFLPISSTAHLRIVPALLGWDDPGAALTAVLQLGTLAAVLGYFLRDLVRMARAALAAVRDPARRDDPDVRLLLSIVVGTVPIAIAGMLAKDLVRGVFRGLGVIATALAFVAVAMAAAERRAAAKGGRGLDAITVRDGLIVGLAQCLALVPGVSRSGITICAALFVGLARADAARYSFLLSVPAVTAAALHELPLVLHGNVPALPLGLGLLAAAVVGYASVAWLIAFLRTRSVMPFVVYRIALAAALAGLFAAGLVH